MIECEECISLPICISSITFKYETHSMCSHNYFMNLGMYEDKCYLIQNSRLSKQNWETLKEFFLKKKGLI